VLVLPLPLLRILRKIFEIKLVYLAKLHHAKCKDSLLNANSEASASVVHVAAILMLLAA
jgi:hypothetical protein